MDASVNMLDLNSLAEPAYVWIGRECNALMKAGMASMMKSKGVDMPEGIPILVGLDRVTGVPDEIRPIMDMLSSPRLESEIVEWLSSGGQDGAGFLDWLVSERLVIRIDPFYPLDSFAGIHLENDGVMLPASGGGLRALIFGARGKDRGLVMAPNDTSKPNIELSMALRTLLFDHPNDEISVAIAKTAGELGMDVGAVQEELFRRLPSLMAGRYAYLLYME